MAGDACLTSQTRIDPVLSHDKQPVTQSLIKLCTRYSELGKGVELWKGRRMVHSLVDEDLAEVSVSARRGSVQRRPQLRVLRVDVGLELEKQTQHRLQVVDAALKKIQHHHVTRQHCLKKCNAIVIQLYQTPGEDHF